MALSTKKLFGIALLVGGAIYYFKTQAAAKTPETAKDSHEPVTDNLMPVPPASNYPAPIAGAPAYINVSDGKKLVKLPIKSKVTYQGRESVVIWQILDENTAKVKLADNRIIIVAKASDLKL